MRQHFPPITALFSGYNKHDMQASIVMENEWPSHEQLRSALVHFPAKFLLLWQFFHMGFYLS